MTYPTVAPAGGSYPIPTNWGATGQFLNTDQDNTNAVANYAWSAADSAPVAARVATTGGETYTIISGSVTVINGPTIDAVTVAVSDVVLVKDAPAASGAGLPLSNQPANGLYYITGLVGGNIQLARCATMSPASSQPNPAGRIVNVRSNGNVGVNGLTEWQVVSPNGVAPFIWGTTALGWGVSPGAASTWVGTTPGVLPATSGQPLATQGGNTLDDGAGNMVVRGTIAVSGASKLLSIANNGSGSSSPGLGAITTTAGTSEMMFTVGVPASNITAEWNHWFTTASGGSVFDYDPSGPIVFSASLRVVSSTNPGTVTGTIWRLTFNGRIAATLDPGGKVVADELGISLAPGDVVAIRTYLASGTAYPPRLTLGGFSTGWGGFTATTDLTAPGSTTIASSTGWYYGPAALLGHPAGANNAKSVLLLGDSQGFGTGDQATYTTPAIGTGGFVNRAINGRAGFINLAIDGDSASSLQSDGGFRRMIHAKYCTSAIIEYSANDLVLGETASQIEAINLNLATIVRRLGIAKVFLTTITPRTSSTDGWATTTNQTVVDAESQRVAYNTWARAGCPIDPTSLAQVAVGTFGALLAGSFGHPITGVFDTASKVESSLNSGLWLPAGRVVTGSMTASTTTLTSSTANFSAATQEAGGDLGTTVALAGAGLGGGGLYVGDIYAVGSTTSVTVDIAATTTVTNAQLAIGIFTVDGTHASPHGHYRMSTAIDVAQL